uniref:Uncharacterized protein n=1 Tax=Oryza glumipatula TaxID=40148 RepID=A0A0E0ACK6_9ORYZ
MPSSSAAATTNTTPSPPSILSSPYCVRSRACVYSSTHYCKLSYKGKQKIRGNLTICYWIHAIGSLGPPSARSWLPGCSSMARSAVLGAGNRRLVVSDVASMPW